MLRRFALALAVTLALPLGSAVLGVQDPVDDPPVGTQDPEDRPDSFQRDIFGRVRKQTGVRSPLLGAWQLLDMEAEGYPEGGLSPNGYLLVADEFLSFEMHVSWDIDDVGEYVVDGFQTFTAEYTLVGGSILQCRTLIGSYLEVEDEELNYEPAGFPREFQVEVDENFLTLRWDQTDRMTFARRRPGVQGREGIYGKPEVLSSRRRGADIFGREGDDAKQVGDEGEGEGGGDDDGR